jgi:toxin FitB
MARCSSRSLSSATACSCPLSRCLSRSLAMDLVDRCLDVMRLGRVLDLTDARAIAASKVSRQHRLALADAAMYSMALEHGATFWTQDVDYDGLSSVRYFAKPTSAR